MTEDTGIPICDEASADDLNYSYGLLNPLNVLFKWLLIVKAVDTVMLCCGIISVMKPDRCDRISCKCEPADCE